MKDRRLFIFVEGNDDQRFFSTIIKPLFVKRYRSVEIVRYACMKRVNVCRFIKTVQMMKHDYMLIADIDQEKTANAKKHMIITRFCNIDRNRIIIIIMEIESWYLAGLDKQASAMLGVRSLNNTDMVTKEHFNRWIPRRYPSRIAFMKEILENYSFHIAEEKNQSFRYFVQKYHLNKLRAARR